jgi:hypothetical protein
MIQGKLVEILETKGRASQLCKDRFFPTTKDLEENLGLSNVPASFVVNKDDDTKATKFKETMLAKYQEELLKRFMDDTANLKNDRDVAYDLIFGQCSKLMRSRIEGHTEYDAASRDPVWLLNTIEFFATNVDDTSYLPGVHNALIRQYYCANLGKGNDIVRYYANFCRIIRALEMYKLRPVGYSDSRVKVEGENEKAEDERQHAYQFLRGLALHKDTKAKYRQIFTQLENDHAKGGKFPQTLLAAYNLVQNYRFDNDPVQQRPDATPTALSFAQLSTLHGGLFSFHQMEGQEYDLLPESWLLLDNQSTVHLVKQKSLLSKIRRTSEQLTLATNGGELITNKVGEFAPFGEVWFCDQAVTNILSLGLLVSNGYRVCFDSDTNCFNLYLNNGTILSFKHHESHLYYVDLDDCNFWSKAIFGYFTC